jgi:hypothetical protein
LLQCLSAGEIYHVFGLRPGQDSVTSAAFVDLCPALIYELEKKACTLPKYDFHEDHSHGDEGVKTVGGDDAVATTTQSSYAPPTKFFPPYAANFRQDFSPNMMLPFQLFYKCSWEFFVLKS